MGLKVSIEEIKNTDILPFNKERMIQYEDSSLYIQWLGQAGFYLAYKDNFLMIDPYLSNSLAEKYKGKEFPHIRMMPPPVHPSEIKELEYILCTHGHSDHMDPGTLPLLAKKDQGRKFIVPKAEKIKAIERGIPESQLTLVNDGDSFNLNDNIKLDVIPSAHEELDKNENSEFYYLGYILKIGPYKIYHSGDCVSYPGLAEKLKSFDIDVALLPVNGRDKYRQERGVPGNFTFDEAVGLCKESEISNLIIQHFGMFSFNTVDIGELKNKWTANKMKGLKVLIPKTDVCFKINLCNRFLN